MRLKASWSNRMLDQDQDLLLQHYAHIEANSMDIKEKEKNISRKNRHPLRV